MTHRRGRLLIGAAIIVLALNLRAAVSSVGVVLGALQDDLGLSPTAAGWLTTLPMLGFAAFGLATAPIVARLGLHRTTALALTALVAGLTLRPVGDAPLAFFALSFLALSGAAIGNIVLPPLAKTHFPDRIGLVSALYGAALLTSAALGSTLSVPVAQSAGGWRLALGMWALLAFAALLPWLGLSRHDVPTEPGVRPALTLRRAVRSPLPWAMAICFAMQAGAAYAQFGWFVQMLVDSGVSPATAGLTLGLLAAAAIPATLALPWLIGRWGDTAVLPIAAGAVSAAGWIGMLLAPAAAPAAWALLLGVGGAAFTWLLAMVGYRALTAAGAAALSVLMQAPGYLIGGALPVLTGYLYDVTGDWTASILMLLASSVLITVFGVVIARSQPLESQLDR